MSKYCTTPTTTTRQPQTGTFYSDMLILWKTVDLDCPLFWSSMLFRKMILVNEGLELSLTTQEEGSFIRPRVPTVECTSATKQTAEWVPPDHRQEKTRSLLLLRSASWDPSQPYQALPNPVLTEKERLSPMPENDSAIYSHVGHIWQAQYSQEGRREGGDSLCLDFSPTLPSIHANRGKTQDHEEDAHCQSHKIKRAGSSFGHNLKRLRMHGLQVFPALPTHMGEQTTKTPRPSNVKSHCT